LNLVLSGTPQIVGVGSTSQLTARLQFTDYSVTDMPSPPEWVSSDPKVASVSPSGVVTAVGFGSAVISAKYQTAIGRQNVQVVQLAPLGLSVATNLSFTSVGQTAQLTALVRYNNNTSIDVTGETQWNSSNPSVVAVTASGDLTTTGLGSATITGQYGTMQLTTVATVLPPGTFVVSGRIRLPGNGGGGELLGVPGFTVTNTDLGNSVVSNAQGQYTIPGVSVLTRLLFEKAGFEPAELVVTGANASPTVQQLIRIVGGGTASATIFENDITYDPSPAFHCDNCRLVRVVNSEAGALHVQIDWTGTSGALLLWTNGTTFGSEAGTKQLIADIPMAAGETALYIRAGSGNFVQLTLKTSFGTGGHWE